MGDMLKGKRGLVMGVANDRSIAWGIAKALADQGAELACSYEGEAFGKRVEPLAQSLGSVFLMDVDVLDDESLARALIEARRHHEATLAEVMADSASDAQTDELRKRG